MIDFFDLKQVKSNFIFDLDEMAVIGKDIVKAQQLLKAGKLVAIPTETVYGLAADALNVDAVLSLFDVKQRPASDPLILHIATNDVLDQYALSIPDKAKKLADRFWPGPLTLVLKKKDIIPNVVTSGLDTVGIRCPRHPLTNMLLAQLPFPLVAPSANPSGYISPTTPAHVVAQFGNKIPYILDGGDSEIGIESTVLSFVCKTPTLYRHGGVSQEEIESVIGDVDVYQHPSDRFVAPGGIANHYVPYKRVVLGDINILLKRFAKERVGVLCFQHCTEDVPLRHKVALSPSGDLKEAAKNLFSSLRLLDQMDIHVILVERMPPVGIGKAINGRLERFASRSAG